MPTPEEALRLNHIDLPPPTGRREMFDAAVQAGNLVFVAGRIPVRADGSVVRGRIGETIGAAEAREAARLTAIRCIAELKHFLGDLSRVERIVRVFGIVNATSDFRDHAKVLDGASEVFIDVFGDRGRHTRAITGTYSMIDGAVVEIEVIAEVDRAVS
jgi:enamine deaminase RidA (YjgF/YER057c/UK114 family)